MKVGINEVIIYDRSSGTRQREINTLPHLLHHLDGQGSQACVYVAKNISSELETMLVGKQYRDWVKRTPLMAVPTYRRIIGGIRYWAKQVHLDNLDIFHTSYYPIPNIPIPTVLTVNDVRFVHLPETYTRARYLFLKLVVSHSLKRATRIITISEDTKKDLITHFSINSQKIDVAYVPIAPQFRLLADENKLHIIREKYKLPTAFILCVGHLEPRKNLMRLIQAFMQLKAKNDIEQKLVILGKKTFGYEPMLKLVAQRGLESEIFFTGYVPDEDMPGLYNLSDLLAFPSLHEGFGVPLLEAMACGVPVVTSNLSALPEIAGDAAIFVDPYQVESIANGIVQVLSDTEIRHGLVIKGFERVKEFCSDKSALVIADSYKKAFEL